MLQHSGRASRTNDWQMTAAVVAVDFQDHRIAWITFNIDFRGGTWRTPWPPLT
jgi:hypothetical protein